MRQADFGRAEGEIVPMPMTAQQAKTLNKLLRRVSLAAARGGQAPPRTSELLGELWHRVPPADGRCWDAYEADEVLELARAVLLGLHARSACAPPREAIQAQAGS